MRQAGILIVVAAVLGLGAAWLTGSFEALDRAEEPEEQQTSATPATAGPGLAGAVHDEIGAPLPDMMVTATHAETGTAVSVFSQSDGSYRIDGLNPGSYSIRAKSLLRLGKPVAVQVDGSLLALDLSAPRDELAARRAPSSQWLQLLPESEKTREFIVNCTACHEIGWQRLTNSDGSARSEDSWAQVIAAMRAIDEYELIPPDFDDAENAAWLAEHFSAEHMSAFVPSEWTLSDAARATRITENLLPVDDSLPHDLVVGPDGRIWITAFFNDLIWAFDPETGQYETYQVKAEGASEWGQTRALEFDADGLLWIILGGTQQLVRLDPATGDLQAVDIGMYAHSLDIDSQGRIWFNDYFSKPERIGFYDPGSGEVASVIVPSADLTEAQGLPLPYGLQVNGHDQLFSTQLTGGTLVQYDISSRKGELVEMPTPNAGPRRPALRADGALWIPEWNTGYLALFNPADGGFQRYKIGPSTLGAYDAETDPRSGVVWITGALDTSMVRFNPKTETAESFPMPTEPAYTRHLAIDPATGDLWSAYSSLPAAKPKLVRVQTAD